MQTLALVAVIAAAMQGASPSVYGPPVPAIPRTPGFGPSASNNVQPVIGVVQKVLSEIRDGRESGQLSRKQAKELGKEAALVSEMEERFARDGLSDTERAEIRTRAELVRANMNAERFGVTK